LFGKLGSWVSGLFGGGAASTSTLSSAAVSAFGGTAAAASSGGFMSWLGSLLPAFAVGADNIPHDMVAQIHKGEMIVPAAGAEAIRSGKLGGGGGQQLHLTIHAMDSQSVLTALHGVRREAASLFSATTSEFNLQPS
jgi:hypothetical protein